MSLFFSCHLPLLNFNLKANWKIIFVTELSITEAMAIIQSKCKMQQSLFIQGDNESNRTTIYSCMASPKKQRLFWAKGDIP